MKHRLSFDIVVRLLQERQRAAEDALRRTKGSEVALEEKRQLDRAIRCLALCENYQIHPDAEVIGMPWPGETFGEMLVVETDETGDKSSWRPVMVEGEEITLQAGDLVIRQKHVFKLPPDPEIR
ncbi:MAG: hypothetical protein K1X48_05080 [Burkholderiaceae bacterium]|nr:hypothetical protein [Burkholderiaceae bacterium]